MLFGCSEIDITPQVPISMGGYGARPGPAKGVSSPLMARSFVFQEGKTKLGFITVDLLMLNREQTTYIREEAERLTGFPSSNIVVSSSHTHSGPSTFSMGGFRAEPDPHYVGWVLRALAGSFHMAAQNLEEVEIGSGEKYIEGIGSSRRDKGEKPSLPLSMLAAKKPKEKDPEGIIINYGCHPTVLGADNLLLSSDFPGAMVKNLRRIFPRTTIGFINGAAGDISTRFKRREQTLSEVERLGKLMAGEVLSLFSDLEFKKIVPGKLKAKTFSLEVPFRNLPSPEDREKEIKRWEKKKKELQETGADPGEIRVVQTGLEGAKIQNHVAELQDQLEKIADITCGVIGEVSFASIPGELFSHLAIPLYSFPGKTTLLCGYSNGHLGYIPDPQSFKEGGYEALSSPLSSSFGEELIQTLEEILKEMI